MHKKAITFEVYCKQQGKGTFEVHREMDKGWH